MTTTFLAELGQAEQALADAEPVAERLQAAGDVVFVEPRSVQLRLLAERGAHEHAPTPDELLAAARESGEPQDYALAFAAVARLLLAQGERQQAQALLAQLEHVAGTRADPYFASVLPELVRTALALDDAALASSLIEGVQPVTPLPQYVLVAGHAHLAKAAGDHAQAATDALRRGGQALARVRERARARLRAARPGSLPVHARQARGGGGATRCARPVRIAGLHARACEDRGPARRERGRRRLGRRSRIRRRSRLRDPSARHVGVAQASNEPRTQNGHIRTDTRYVSRRILSLLITRFAGRTASLTIARVRA